MLVPHRGQKYAPGPTLVPHRVQNVRPATVIERSRLGTGDDTSGCSNIASADGAATVHRPGPALRTQPNTAVSGGSPASTACTFASAMAAIWRRPSSVALPR